MITLRVDRHDASRMVDALRIASGEDHADPARLRQQYPTTAARYTLMADTLGDALDDLPVRQLPPCGPDLALTEAQLVARIDNHVRGVNGGCQSCPDSGSWSRHLARVLLGLD